MRVAIRRGCGSVSMNDDGPLDGGPSWRLGVSQMLLIGAGAFAPARAHGNTGSGTTQPAEKAGCGDGVHRGSDSAWSFRPVHDGSCVSVKTESTIWDASAEQRAEWRANAKSAQRKRHGTPKSKRRRKRRKPRRPKPKYGQWSNASLKRAGFETYADYMESPAWREKRDALLREHRHECWCCSKKRAVSAHHLHYRTIGAEREGDMVPVCSPCHRTIHLLAPRQKISIEQATYRVRRERKGVYV